MKVNYDVLIVGGGPAGLSAALAVGRMGRSALICDDGRPREKLLLFNPLAFVIIQQIIQSKENQ